MALLLLGWELAQSLRLLPLLLLVQMPAPVVALTAVLLLGTSPLLGLPLPLLLLRLLLLWQAKLLQGPARLVCT